MLKLFLRIGAVEQMQLGKFCANSCHGFNYSCHLNWFQRLSHLKADIFPEVISRTLRLLGGRHYLLFLQDEEYSVKLSQVSLIHVQYIDLDNIARTVQKFLNQS